MCFVQCIITWFISPFPPARGCSSPHSLLPPLPTLARVNHLNTCSTVHTLQSFTMLLIFLHHHDYPFSPPGTPPSPHISFASRLVDDSVTTPWLPQLEGTTCLATPLGNARPKTNLRSRGACKLSSTYSPYQLLSSTTVGELHSFSHLHCRSQDSS